MSPERVVVAMSGGVDSSVAAALLQEAGYEVTGVTMQILPANVLSGKPGSFNAGGGLESVQSARQVSRKLGTTHYVMDFRDIFAERVIADFCREYSLGRTPNPCIRCNRHIKFDVLLQKAHGLGAAFLATGHYARIEKTPNGYRLLKGVDKTKDQSYFLYTLGQKELKSLLLPVGNLNKNEVRSIASRLGLPAADRPASQDICFIPDNNYRSFVAGYVPAEPGNIVDTEGNILGRHHGLINYTVGQRQGLGLASNTRLYVVKLDADTNSLIVGTEDRLFSSALYTDNLVWVSGKPPADTTRITAKVRYRSPETPSTLHLNDETARVEFHQPQRAISPGQSVVFYQGDTVLGGGIIENAECTADTIIC